MAVSAGDIEEDGTPLFAVLLPNKDCHGDSWCVSEQCLESGLGCDDSNTERKRLDYEHER